LATLLTGATGQLGAEVARQLGGTIIVVSRRDRTHTRGRLRALLAPEVLNRIEIVSGDVGAPEWGLEWSEVNDLLGSVDTVVNLAAYTDWSGPQSIHYRSNVVGAANTEAVAARVQKLRQGPITAVHVSSAYALEPEFGWVAERLGPVAARASEYERSKAIGERYFLSGPSPDEVKRVIVRFAGLGPPAQSSDDLIAFRSRGPRLYAAGQGRSIPVVVGDPNGRIDVIPVDEAARLFLSFIEASQSVSDGFVGHIVLGETAPRLSSLVASINDLRDSIGRGPIRLIPVRFGTLDAVSRTLANVPGLAQASAQSNRLIGLRYMSRPVFFSRERMRAANGGSEPQYNSDALARMVGVVAARPSSEAPTGAFADMPFGLFS
jgi:nucleoside-diphosphate-sugar epimerase